jgi:hypothetical protein
MSSRAVASNSSGSDSYRRERLTLLSSLPSLCDWPIDLIKLVQSYDSIKIWFTWPEIGTEKASQCRLFNLSTLNLNDVFPVAGGTSQQTKIKGKKKKKNEVAISGGSESGVVPAAAAAGVASLAVAKSCYSIHDTPSSWTIWGPKTSIRRSLSCYGIINGHLYIGGGQAEDSFEGKKPTSVDVIDIYHGMLHMYNCSIWFYR